MLTDGEIDNSDETIDLIKKYSHNTWLHTFGIGKVDKSLVLWMAEAGRGSCFIVEDLKLLRWSVVNALKEATIPCFSNLNVEWKSSEF